VKNILYIDTGYEAGGGTKSFLYLLEFLDKTKYKPFVFFKNDYKVGDKFLSEIVKEKGGEFIKLNIKKKKLSKIKKELLRVFMKNILEKELFRIRVDYANEILKLIVNKYKIDIIHLNNHFSTNLEYIYIANQLKIPVIQHLRKNSKLKKWEIAILNKQKFISICVSKSTYNFYKPYILDKNIIYNPFIINLKPYKKDNSNKIKILFPANYLENKGHKIVFEAIKNLDNITLYLAGSGKFDNNTEKLKNSLQNVVELGFVNLDEWYKKVDYVISFSEKEGLPRVVIEGLLYGCGIICSDYEVSFEIFELSSKKDFFIIKRDSKILNKLLKNLIPISEKKPDEKLKQIFSLDSYIQKIENLYKSLL